MLYYRDAAPAYYSIFEDSIAPSSCQSFANFDTASKSEFVYLALNVDGFDHRNMSLTRPTTSNPLLTRVDNIPTATIQCHASNLLELPDKTLLCVWFGGTQEGTDNISVYLSRLVPGSSWSTPERLSSDPSRSKQNPVQLGDPVTATIWLFHTAQPAGNQDQAVIIARTSPDQGHTWSEPFEPFPEKKGVFIRQPIVVLPDDTRVLPIWYCRVPPGFRWIGSDVTAESQLGDRLCNTSERRHYPCLQRLPRNGKHGATQGPLR